MQCRCRPIRQLLWHGASRWKCRNGGRKPGQARRRHGPCASPSMPDSSSSITAGPARADGAPLPASPSPRRCLLNPRVTLRGEGAPLPAAPTPPAGQEPNRRAGAASASWKRVPLGPRQGPRQSRVRGVRTPLVRTGSTNHAPPHDGGLAPTAPSWDPRASGPRRIKHEEMWTSCKLQCPCKTHYYKCYAQHYRFLVHNLWHHNQRSKLSCRM